MNPSLFLIALAAIFGASNAHITLEEMAQTFQDAKHGLVLIIDGTVKDVKDGKPLAYLKEELKKHPDLMAQIETLQNACPPLLEAQIKSQTTGLSNVQEACLFAQTQWDSLKIHIAGWAAQGLLTYEEHIKPHLDKVHEQLKPVLKSIDDFASPKIADIKKHLGPTFEDLKAKGTKLADDLKTFAGNVKEGAENWLKTWWGGQVEAAQAAQAAKKPSINDDNDDDDVNMRTCLT